MKGWQMILIVLLLVAVVVVAVVVTSGDNLDAKAENMVRDYWRQKGAASCQIDKVSGARISPKAPKEYAIIGVAHFADGLEYPFTAQIRFEHGSSQGRLLSVSYDPLRKRGFYNQPGFHLN